MGDAGDDVTVMDGGDASDAGTDAPPATYNDITNGINWGLFADPSAMLGYATPTFDGKYIYYAPLYGGTSYHGNALRFDTTGSFQSMLSWSTYDMTQINSKAKGYMGTVFDGRYVYYLPFASDAGVMGTIAMRYDTQGSFTNGASWAPFDVSPLDARAGGFGGGTFDGRYIYAAPYICTPCNPSIAVRYDTKASFASGASWQTFDLATKGANTYAGAVFDGRYVYYVPALKDSGLVVRFDTQGNFKDANAWTIFDLKAQVNPAAVGFLGATFDGRYMYFVPYQFGAGGVIARFDTQGSFTNKAAWQTFDLGQWKSNATAFWGAVFDGKYVYFVPSSHNLIVRYDTQSSFTSGASYTSFDLAAYTKKMSPAFAGGAFDGEFLYIAPGQSTPMVRFDAKTPPSLPSTHHGSFF